MANFETLKVIVIVGFVDFIGIFDFYETRVYGILFIFLGFKKFYVTFFIVY